SDRPANWRIADDQLCLAAPVRRSFADRGPDRRAHSGDGGKKLMTLSVVLLVSAALFCIGLLAALSRRHAIFILIGIEMMLAAAAILGQIAPLRLSIFAFLPPLHSQGFRAIQNFTWFTFGEQILRFGFVLDPFAAAMLMMIALVGLCIFVFSIGYMAEDKNFSRFFAYLSFFSGAMLGVVVANSLLLLFVFWELVGLASFLLIGFWIERPSAAAAAKKAFITTRIGDMGFFLGILWLYHRSGTLLFYDGGRGCLEPLALSA